MSYTIKGVVYTSHGSVPFTYINDESILCDCCGHYWGQHSGLSCLGRCGQGKPVVRPKITTKPFVIK